MDQMLPNVMTIDVEDWYHSSLDLFKDSPVEHGSRPDPSVVDNTLHALDLLSETNNKATFFVLGTVAEHYPDVVKEIIVRGHEVASHGYAHELIYNITATEFEDDLKRSLEHLAKAGCAQILGYRAPYWSITKRSLWALDVLSKLGFKYDSSIFPIRRGLYGIPDATPYPHKVAGEMWEFPPATLRFLAVNFPIAGGGYLRLMPYKLVSWAIRKARAEHAHVKVFYFHPYELDPQDVKLQHKSRSPATLLYWAQQIVGRGDNPDKLRRLMKEFQFVSFKQILSKMPGGQSGGQC